MSRRSPSIRILLPLTSAAQILGMKFDSLMAAARDGRLCVESGALKPGARVQPLVTIAALRMFARVYADEFLGFDSAYHQRIVRRLERARYPEASMKLAAALSGAPRKTRRAPTGRHPG